MLEIDEGPLKAIIASVDETIGLINEKKDVRTVCARLGNVSNKIRAMAELKENPDNRFVSFILQYILSDITARFQGHDDEWYNFNKQMTDECLSHLKNLLVGLKSALQAKNFEKAIDTMKMFFFVYWKIILYTST